MEIEPTPAALLSRAVLDDLDVVATTRLLGRDQELYAEVDRNRSGVQLRLAVIPPLLALAIAVGAKSDPWLCALLVSITAIFEYGLFKDAVRSEKQANQILLQSIEDRRVRSPTLERWESEAANQASKTRPELLQPTAEDAVVALQRAAASLQDVGRSEPSLASYARRQVDLAQEPITRVTQLFPQPVVQVGQEALRLLTEVADDWLAVIDGHGPPGDDPHERLTHAQRLTEDFQVRAREAVRNAAAPPASSSREPEQPEPAS
jgi:hypothetical protein